LPTNSNSKCRKLAEQQYIAFPEDNASPTSEPVDKAGVIEFGHSISWMESNHRFSGDGTAFSDSVNNTGSGFACSFRYLNNKFSKYFAAMNQAQWENGASCGRCVLARCVDPRCKVQNKDVLVQIVDLCPECKPGDVDFSFDSYKEITGLWPHRLHITWKFTSCADDVSGSINFDPKDGITQFWQAFYLSNMRYPIKTAKLNGKELMRSPYQFFIHAAMMPTGPSNLTIVADNGETITATIDDMTKRQDLKVQFPLSE